MATAALPRLSATSTKQEFGERLYPLVCQLCAPDVALQVTGMLLELTPGEMMALIIYPDRLASKVAEAKVVLGPSSSSASEMEEVELSPAERTQALGTALYPLVSARCVTLGCHARTAKITGMFLEMDDAEVRTLIASKKALEDKIDEAIQVLNHYDVRRALQASVRVAGSAASAAAGASHGSCVSPLGRRRSSGTHRRMYSP